ncbi:MAG: hypothetical protein AAGF23_17670 [Acidobacteriota bacterium]
MIRRRSRPRSILRRWGAVCGAWLAAALLLTDLAGAHPFDADFYSARAIVTTEDGDISVRVAVEVPTRRVLEQFLELYGDPGQLNESSEAIFTQRQFKRLARELRLRIGGRRAVGKWRPAPGESNGRGTNSFFLYVLEFAPKDPATLRAEKLDLRIDMEVFPREFIYVSAFVEVEEPWRVTSNSAEAILEAAGDEFLDPETGRWSVDPRLRRVKLVLERSDGEP